VFWESTEGLLASGAPEGLLASGGPRSTNPMCLTLGVPIGSSSPARHESGEGVGG
jgi:hypothetical protein